MFLTFTFLYLERLAEERRIQEEEEAAKAAEEAKKREEEAQREKVRKQRFDLLRSQKPGIRSLDLKKLPSVSKTIDWARVLVLLHAAQLDHAMVRETLNVLLKFESDIEAVEPQITDLLLKAKREAVPVR